ncbi:MAG: ATP-dependent helicase HrpB [Bryobacterales bacterium]|nr:ATP-dependent helicase HrpB [Bryobacterales bacterium]
MSRTPSLPVDALLPEILAHLRATSNLVLEAEPGAGKTTRVPPVLLEFGEVLVLEPRRVAARMAARRVAQEMGETPGGTVGYQVRFDEAAGPRTRLRFLTEGVLTRRLLADPELRGVAVVVLDEFHERHLDGDAALALLLRLQRTARPDLKLVVMSATIEGGRVAAHLGGCPVVRSRGRLFDTVVEYTPFASEPLEETVASALERVSTGGLDGDVLVFLPGAREIRAAMRACERTLARLDAEGLPLFGDLPPEEQDRALLPSPRRKVIFSTNVAESSLTIEGVRVVIDSGLARVARDSVHTGLPELYVTRISQASATQRAGRAGRTGPGRVVRLYPREDLLRRPAQDTPEILRRELSGLCLELQAMRVGDPEALPWLDAPPEASLAAARELLKRIGASGGDQAAMARLPLHPRLSAMCIEAGRRGASELACEAAALLSAGEYGRESRGGMDLLDALHREPSFTARRIRDQVARIVKPRRGARDEAGLLHAVLRGYADRLRRLRDGSLAVALDIEERKDRGEPLLRLYARVEPEWLIDLWPERVEERDTVEWHRTGERVERVSALVFDGLVLEETRGRAVDPARAAALLAAKALETGLHRFAGQEELAAYHLRRAFAAGSCGVPPLDEEVVRETLESLCQGLTSFSELAVACRDGAFCKALDARLDAGARRRFEELAPARLRLPSGRTAAVRYEPGKPPVVAARLQEFFGMKESPRIGGATPLLIELLAPNMRPVQTTTDLAGFWARLYPQLRRELGRRYPKHSWPEDPLTASPPERR